VSKAEEMREVGASLMFAGLAVWAVGLLVLFFRSAVRIGLEHGGRFAAILPMTLGVTGVALLAGGWWMRREGGE
jgi:hypothetical protein